MLVFFFFFLSLSLSFLFNSCSWMSLLFYLGICCFYMVFLVYTPMLNNTSVFDVFYLDVMSSVLILLSFWITSMMIMCSYKINIFDLYKSFFMFTLYFLLFVLFMTFLVNNLLSFYILFEISLIPTLVLIMGWGYQPERLQAGMYLMMYTMSASLPLLLIIMYMSSLSGSLYMGFMLPLCFSFIYYIDIMWLMCIMAFLVKMPMYLTHLWLPKAHVEAPVAGSMILAGVLLKLGGYGLLRLNSLFISGIYGVSGLLVSISMWGACMTSLICLRQVDLKSLIAYSSVGHMGLLISGLASNQSWGWYGSLSMMIAHGLVSSGLFCLANMTYENTSTRSIYLVKGLLSVLPSMSIFWFILSIMNMGAPPSINLLSEIILLTSILSFGLDMSILIAFSSFLAAAYSLYLYTSTHHGQVGLYLNGVISCSFCNFNSLILHIIPAIFFILCGQYITFWV